LFGKRAGYFASINKKNPHNFSPTSFSIIELLLKKPGSFFIMFNTGFENSAERLFVIFTINVKKRREKEMLREGRSLTEAYVLV
jgi:hypothetical protein